jgi:hypothetical protein
VDQGLYTAGIDLAASGKWTKEAEVWPAFQSVRKWTKGANIFERDFIVVPINEK